jgi:hypothetical protein
LRTWIHDDLGTKGHPMIEIQIPSDDDTGSRHYVRRGRWAGSRTSPALIGVRRYP